MASLISAIETKVRLRLDEPTARFWSSDEIVAIIAAGIYDLWRPMVDLKQEYFLTVDATNVSLTADTSTLTGIPSDVYKIYALEVRDGSSTSSNKNLFFEPLEYNHSYFENARTLAAVEPTNNTIFYTVIGAGGPVAAPTIRVAPQVSSAVDLTLTYVPTIGTLTSASTVPLPGEVDNALIAWAVAYARAKERDDKDPDPNWLSIYATEKQNLLQSLGLRNLHKPLFVDGLFQENW